MAARKLVIPHPRDLYIASPFMEGKDVWALQRALAVAECRDWGNFTNVFGQGTHDAVMNFQKWVASGLEATGIYNRATHEKLARYYDGAGKQAILDYMHKPTGVKVHKESGVHKTAPVPSTDPRTKLQRAIFHAASHAYNVKDKLRYSQGGDRWNLINFQLKPHALQATGHHLAADCSSFATWLYWAAMTTTGISIPDPNDAGWRAGCTGTLSAHGKIWTGSFASAPIGALYFYGTGNERPCAFYHVAISIGGGQIISHGGPTGAFDDGPREYGLRGNEAVCHIYPGVHY